ncbi:MAG: ribosomal L7Ae/L30e/S12e/Gadd45 family protein [Firmicutes bacterium]|nr:ribosomal L7Ae/L30e/S12e/Gadd45 family protein [Bacillota bacterium]
MVDRSLLKNVRQRVVGRRETLKHIQRHQATVVYLARDADALIASEIEEQCRTHEVPIVYVDTMKELGQWCGIEVKAACAAVIDRSRAPQS